MALGESEYKPVSLDVKKVRFDGEQDIHNTRQKSRKIQSVTDCTVWEMWCNGPKC